MLLVHSSEVKPFPGKNAMMAISYTQAAGTDGARDGNRE